MPASFYTPPGPGAGVVTAVETDRTARIDKDIKRNAARNLAAAGEASYPTIALTVSAASAAEEAVDPAFVFTATLSRAVAFDVIVTPTWSGTATNVTDYTRPADATKTIAAGQTSVTFPCAIVDNATDEAAETVILTIAATGLGNALVVTPAGALAKTFTINDDVDV